MKVKIIADGVTGCPVGTIRDAVLSDNGQSAVIFLPGVQSTWWLSPGMFEIVNADPAPTNKTGSESFRSLIGQDVTRLTVEFK